MEAPKFLRKYKKPLTIFKYVIGFIIVLYLTNLCTYLVSGTDTVCCILGILIQVSVILLVIAIAYDDIENLLKKLEK